MNRDKKQHPANTDRSAGSTEAEREAEIEKLRLRRTKLTVKEAALLYSIDRSIVDEHHKLVWSYLRKRVRSNDDIEELFQEVFIALYKHILENGFPEDLSEKIHSKARVVAAKDALYVLAAQVLPLSQRGLA